MGLWIKLSDVLRANINDMLDKATDPIKQLNLMLEDMHTFRGQQVAAIGKAMVGLKHVEADLAQAREDVQHWARRAETATASKQDDNARLALQNQIQQEKLVATLESALAEHNAGVEKLKLELGALDSKTQWLESQRSVIMVRVRTAQAEKGLHGTISFHGSAPRVDQVLERVESQVRDIEAEASAAGMVADLATPKTAEAQFQAAEMSNEVEKRLAALKASQK